MIAALLVAAAAFVVFAIAAVAVGRVVATEAARPRQAVYDLHEATDWVAERLPFEVQARLSHDDVHTVLSWYLDELEAKGVAYQRDEKRPDTQGPGALVVDEDSAAAKVIGRIEASSDLDLSDVEVVLILEAGAGYLQAIGAVGGEAPAPESP